MIMRKSKKTADIYTKAEQKLCSALLALAMICLLLPTTMISASAANAITATNVNYCGFNAVKIEVNQNEVSYVNFPGFTSAGLAIVGRGKEILTAGGDITKLQSNLYAESTIQDGMIMVGDSNCNDPYSRYGYVNLDGKLVIPCTYMWDDDKTGGYAGDISCHFSQGLVWYVDRVTGKCGYYDKSGNVAIDPIYAKAMDFASNGLAVVGKGNDNGCGISYGFIDTSGHVVIPLIYNNCMSFSDGLARVSIDGKYGFVDETGKRVIDTIYSDAYDFSEGMALVCLDGQWQVINKNGDKVFDCNYCIESSDLAYVMGAYYYMHSFHDGLMAVGNSDRPIDSTWGYINTKGELVIDYQFIHGPNFHSGYAIMTDNGGNSFLIDTAGNTVISTSENNELEMDGNRLYIRDADNNILFVDLTEGTTSQSNADGLIGSGNPYVDVLPGAYYYDAVQWAVKSNITSGTTAITFTPDSTCTRGQILTLLWRANGSPESKIANPFTDVSGNDYYYKAALWAYENKLVSGSVFAASAFCTREQAVTYLWKLAGSPSADTAADFTDVDTGSETAQAVAWAVKQKVTSGTTVTTFSPNTTCTRGQIVTFLYRTLA